jgi:hypothetical protein
MTDETAPTSILPHSRTRRVALTVAFAAVALLGTAGAVTAQSNQPTISVTGATTVADGTTTVDVVLTEAPDGLSGYYLSLAVGDGEVAQIESASYPDRFGLTTDPDVGPEGRTVTLEAADVEGAIESGATNVTLATIEVAGGTPGEARITVEPRQFDSDNGTQFQPSTQPGVVTVDGEPNDAAGSGAGEGTGETAGGNATSSATTSDATTSDAGSGTPTTAGDGGDANAELFGFGFSAPLFGGVVLGVVAALIAVGVGRQL